MGGGGGKRLQAEEKGFTGGNRWSPSLLRIPQDEGKPVSALLSREAPSQAHPVTALLLAPAMWPGDCLPVVAGSREDKGKQSRRAC